MTIIHTIQGTVCMASYPTAVPHHGSCYTARKPQCRRRTVQYCTKCMDVLEAIHVGVLHEVPPIEHDTSVHSIDRELAHWHAVP